MELWVDCGKSGGYIATHDGDILCSGELKFDASMTSVSFKNRYCSKAYDARSLEAIHIELLKPFGRDTATTAFRMGMCYATLQKTIHDCYPLAVMLKHEPREWKKAMREIAGGRLHDDQKQEALLFVISQIGKKLTDELSMKKTKNQDGIIDAIAMYLAMKKDKK